MNKILKNALIAVLIAGTSVVTFSGLNATQAELSWQDIKPSIFGNRTILSGQDIINLNVPYRAEDDRNVPIALNVKFEDGRSVKAVTLIVDENPMPVAAVFRFNSSRTKVALSTKMRFNGPSPFRAVVEASDGKLYMSESMIKTTGLGACASPPVGDPAQALASLGQMNLNDVSQQGSPKNSSLIRRRARLKIKHPNLTGLQMDQIKLHYIPARFVNEIKVSQGEDELFTVESGITLIEDPEIEFDYVTNGASQMTVRIKDTSGSEFEKKFPIGAGS